jgi:hypothetical protein
VVMHDRAVASLGIRDCRAGRRGDPKTVRLRPAACSLTVYAPTAPLNR